MPDSISAVVRTLTLCILTLTLAIATAFADGNSFPAQGKVGIGTQQPTAKLDVRGNTRIDGALKLDNTLRLQSWKSPMGSHNYYLDIYNDKGIYAGNENGIRICRNKDCSDGGKLYAGTRSLIIESMGADKEIEVRSSLGAKELRAAKVCVSGDCRESWPTQKNLWQEKGHNIFRGAGWVGIGVNQPRADLHIKRELANKRNYVTLRVENTKGMDKGAQIELINGDDTQVQYNLGVGGDKNGKLVEDKFFIWKQNANGSAGDLLLTLDRSGTLKVRKIQVTQKNWSDFVFEENYPLLSLSEVEQYVAAEKHLPGVPSAAEVARDGIDIANMDATLLKKVEELTLYQIQLQKSLQQLQQEMSRLREENQQLLGLRNETKEGA